MDLSTSTPLLDAITKNIAPAKTPQKLIRSNVFFEAFWQDSHLSPHLFSGVSLYIGTVGRAS